MAVASVGAHGRRFTAVESVSTLLGSLPHTATTTTATTATPTASTTAGAAAKAEAAKATAAFRTIVSAHSEPSGTSDGGRDTRMLGHRSSSALLTVLTVLTVLTDQWVDRIDLVGRRPLS